MPTPRVLAGTSLVALAAVSLAQAAPPARLTPAEVAERATPSIVLVEVPGGVGTGFVAGPNGRVATNLHVIRRASEATVVTTDGHRSKDVEVLAVDEANDLALLRVNFGSDAPPPLPLGDSAAVKAGEHVVAIGHPLGLDNTVSDGLVSAVRVISPQVTVLQISAPISPGSSGGPLFDDRGQVIGVSTSFVARGQNLNFAVPIDALKPLLRSEEGTPIGKFTAANRVERHVPQHPLSLLDGCSADRQRAITAAIGKAIDLGAPLYNEGNVEACYRIYAAAALDVDKTVSGCPGPRRALRDGIRTADSLAGYDAKAWAMRDAFDGVLDVVALRAGGGAETSTAPSRHVPHHPLSLLADCDPADAKRIREGIGTAIESGAPLYNEGNVEACYRIYAGAIADLDRQVAGCPAARRALREGLEVAAHRASFPDKAWALRDAFDGMLDVIERHDAAKE